jgi:hypothetical protein
MPIARSQVHRPGGSFGACCWFVAAGPRMLSSAHTRSPRYGSSIGKSNDLFHRLRAPTLSPTLHHRVPAVTEAIAQEAFHTVVYVVGTFETLLRPMASK